MDQIKANCNLSWDPHNKEFVLDLSEFSGKILLAKDTNWKEFAQAILEEINSEGNLLNVHL